MHRILHVISGLAVGGAEIALYRLIVSSHGGKYVHAVVSLTPEGVIAQRLRETGIEVTTFDFKASPISHFLKLLFLIRKIRPDIVQTWMYHADMIGGLAARFAGNRNVIWGVRVTDSSVGDSPMTSVVRRICARLSRWVPHTIVCVAEAVRRTHVVVGYDMARMVVVPNGFDLSRLVATSNQRVTFRAQCGFNADHVVIGTLGRFNANKDQQNFIQAGGLLAARHTNLRFLMIGRGLNTRNTELMHWISQTGFAERFVLLDERSDVPVCLAAMDVFCLSSCIEGFPNVVGEAMAMGVPCVVTDVGDAAMLVGDTGIVVPKKDSNALADGLAHLLTMAPEARQQLGQKAKARIYAEFTMERSRERFENIYQRLTREGKR